MTIETRLRVGAPANHANLVAPAPLILQTVTEKGTKTFELTVRDMQRALKAEPGCFDRLIDVIWDAIRDCFCGTRRAEANAYLGAAMRAKDDATMAENYFALRAMATPATRDAVFGERYDATTHEYILSINTSLCVELRVSAAALPFEEAKRLGLTDNVAPTHDAPPHDAPPHDALPHDAPPHHALTRWATTTCHFTDRGIKLREVVAWVDKAALVVEEPYTVDVGVDELGALRFGDWRSNLEFESPAAGQCIYEVDLGVGGSVRSENVGATRIDSRANEQILLGFVGALRAGEITFHQASAVAFLMQADTAAQAWMDLAAARDPGFDRTVSNWACRHHFSIMRNGPDIVVAITSESKLSDEQLRLSATGARPGPHRAVTFRQQWLVVPTGSMRCLLATAEPKPAERAAHGPAAPDVAAPEAGGDVPALPRDVDSSGSAPGDESRFSSASDVEGGFPAAPEWGDGVPALPDIDVSSSFAPGDESGFFSAADVKARGELSQRSPDPHIAAFDRWYGALTPSARKLLANCTNLRGFLPRVLAVEPDDTPLWTERVVGYLTGKVRGLPAGLAEPAPEIPVEVQGELSGLLDHAPYEQTIALLHRLNLELWVDSLDPQYQHGFAQEHPDEPVPPPEVRVVSNRRAGPAPAQVFLTPEALTEIYGPSGSHVLARQTAG
ncbi:hypothetical protein [Pandoraea oxalativorans]|uniref:Uncharacterized protein n=1 Tax=Pandoraea oxalativorans TaxID=573737 RepID=A0A0G3IIG2_9BURK|nr:hypothetical protein [Pandoraea oxalativorans]AKK24895.1 hypothetical protein MB84_29470 [Pandoraea oxalativorans]